MNQPYLREFAQLSGLTVWIVDGTYVRDNMDIEFTNFGQHHRFSFIPKDEFWIDEEHSHSEEKFYVLHMLIEHRLMGEGASYEAALAEADRIEQEERNNSERMQKLKKKGVGKEDIIGLAHKELFAQFGELSVWIVDGELVRSGLYIEFTEGGHDKVYNFVPENEIWLDDDLGAQERKIILLHEIYERNLMLRNWSYFIEEEAQTKNRRGNRSKSAHTAASALECACRKDPDLLAEKLAAEIEKVSKKCPLLIAAK